MRKQKDMKIDLRDQIEGIFSQDSYDIQDFVSLCKAWSLEMVGNFQKEFKDNDLMAMGYWQAKEEIIKRIEESTYK